MGRFLAAASTVIALIVLAGIPPASSIHWCGETAVSVAPMNPVAGSPNEFTVTVRNTGPGTTTLSQVEVEFSWEASDHELGSGVLTPGQSLSFVATATPPSVGPHVVEVRLRGTNSNDAFGEVRTCPYAIQVEAVSSPFAGVGAFLLFLVLLIVGAAVLVFVARRGFHGDRPGP